jgi:adenine phosphoribosyltransferase
VDPSSLRSLVRDIPDFPEPGVDFKDITPLLADPVGFRSAIDSLIEPFRDAAVDLVVGIEARGFVFSAPVAHGLAAGLVPIRKPGKLPWTVDSVTYELEYGGGTLEMHTDAVLAGHRCLIVDDVLATGGTAQAARQLVERRGGLVVGCSFLIELGFLGGRSLLGGGAPVHSTITYAS